MAYTTSCSFHWYTVTPQPHTSCHIFILTKVCSSGKTPWGDCILFKKWNKHIGTLTNYTPRVYNIGAIQIFSVLGLNTILCKTATIYGHILYRCVHLSEIHIKYFEMEKGNTIFGRKRKRESVGYIMHKMLFWITEFMHNIMMNNAMGTECKYTFAFLSFSLFSRSITHFLSSWVTLQYQQ